MESILEYRSDQLWPKVAAKGATRAQHGAKSDDGAHGQVGKSVDNANSAAPMAATVANDQVATATMAGMDTGHAVEIVSPPETVPIQDQNMPTGAGSDQAASGSLTVVSPKVPYKLPKAQRLIRSQNGTLYIEMRDRGNPYAVPLNSSQADAIIRDAAAQERGVALSRAEVGDVKYYLQGYAARTAVSVGVWYRVAPIAGGIEIDAGDDAHTRYRITAGKVEVIRSGSEVVFYRTSASLPLAVPAEVGDAKLLRRYISVHPATFNLVLGWITYTLASPKSPTTKYVILVLQAGQGSGKSAATKLILSLIDPSRVGVQTLHRNPKDFAIAAQSAHLLAFDNLREISPELADLLCVASTGGSISCRQLYTDAEQTVLNLHVALILNGIHQFVQQQDFAQRTLPLTMRPILESERKSEEELAAGLATDLPIIQRGLFDLIARIFEQLPNARVTSPTRMIGFSKWLAAMELVYGTPPGVFQDLYRDALNQGQLDSLQECVLAASMLDFAEKTQDGHWQGSPTELLNLLNRQATSGTQRSRDWPQNPIALSKRLLPLQAGLLSQGVVVELTRGKTRSITIKKTGGIANS